VEAEMDAGYGIYAGGRRLWATLVFDTQAAPWVSREQWHAEQKGRWLEDGRYELTVPYTEDTEIVMDILRHGDQVVVAAPASLAKAVKAKLAAAARRYGR
jgi:predicted DNA-binding transcriptional regulator YafY